MFFPEVVLVFLPPSDQLGYGRCDRRRYCGGVELKGRSDREITRDARTCHNGNSIGTRGGKEEGGGKEEREEEQKKEAKWRADEREKGTMADCENQT